MPVVGLGVWRMEGNEIRDLVINALNLGYRHFDCAADYKNEPEVGEALAEAFSTGLVKREDLFLTTKLWNSDHGHVVEACKDSLKKLRLDYLDLYLVHFPVATKLTVGTTGSALDEDGVLEIDTTISLETTWHAMEELVSMGLVRSIPTCNIWESQFQIGTTGSALDEDGVLEIDTTISLETTWHAMEELVSMGLVRSIGISNHDIFLTRDCLAYSKVKPAVNQIETHPYFQRESLVKFCQKRGICVTLGGAVANSEWFGSVSCLDDPVLKNLAEKYKKTAAQVFDFELIKEDMDLIAKVDRKHRTNQPAKFWGVDLFA